MSVHSPDRSSAQWKADIGPAPVRLLLDGIEGEASALVGAKIAGFPLDLVLAGASEDIDPAAISGSAAAVVQVTENDEASLARFKKLAAGPVPLIAAAYDPSLAFVRSLVRLGAHDVVPLAARSGRARNRARSDPPNGSGHRSATEVRPPEGRGDHQERRRRRRDCLLGQLAARFAQREAAHGREACLIDLDVQFGDAALQLGLQPALTFTDLLEAGTRLDGDLLRAIAVQHRSGLQVMSAPRQIMPLEVLTSDQCWRSSISPSPSSARCSSIFRPTGPIGRCRCWPAPTWC